MLTTIFAVVATLHFAIVGRIPPGSDVGNWLALARDLLGEPVMSADVAYPPVVPGVLAMLSQVASPLESLAIVGLTSRLAVGLAVYIVLRGSGRLAAGLGSALALLAGYQSEIFSFGGYPQLLGAAFAVLALHMSVSYLQKPRRLALVGTVVFSLLTVLTHTFTTAVLLGGAAVGVVALVLLGRLANGYRSILHIGVAFIPAVVVFTTWILSPSLSGNPAINPQGFRYDQIPTLLGSFVKESPLAWAALTAGALAVVGIGLLRSRDHVPIEAVAWMISGAAVWIVFLEQRSLAFVQIGIILAVSTVPTVLVKTRVPVATVAALSAFLLIAGAVAAVQGAQRFDDAVAYYRVVGHAELRTLEELTRLSDPTDVVLSTRGRNDHHLGWWVEGYAGRQTFTAADPSYLAFSDEQQQAEIALRIFAGELNPSQFLEFTTDVGIEYVVVDKRGPDAAWLSTPTARMLRRVVDSPTLVVLDVP